MKMFKNITLILLFTLFFINAKAQYLVPEYVQNYDNTKPTVYAIDLGGGYQQVADSTAKADLSSSKRVVGMMVSYKENGIWVTERYKGTDVLNTNWRNPDNWDRLALYGGDKILTDTLATDVFILNDSILKYAKSGDTISTTDWTRDFVDLQPFPSFGNEFEIPISNATGIDFNYSSNFAFNGNTLELESDSGFNNVFIGKTSGNSILTGDNNIFLGSGSGYSTTTGTDNIFIGLDAGYLNETGNSNIFIGSNSGISAINAVANIFLGQGAGFNHESGQDNTFLGYNSGHDNISGSGNVFLGYTSGYNETGSNKLYIENSNSANPLIYGEFDNDKLRFNADTSTFAGHVKVDSNIYVYGRAIFDKYEVAAYIDPDSTVTTSINSTTWTFLGDGANNKFTNLYTEGFSLDGDTLQFDQEITDLRDSIEFRFSAHALTSSSGVNKTIFYTIQIKSVGESTYTEIRQITSGSQTSTAGVYYPGPTCTTMPVYLKDGDKIQIVAKCAASTTDINTKYGKVYLREE